MKLTGRLENWCWDPLLNIIWGYIYDDTRGRFPDGTHIHTSDIDSKHFVNSLKEGSVIPTRNSFYLLGKPKD